MLDIWRDAPFDPEPITVVLRLVSTAITALLSAFGSRLEEEEFSLPYALAYGYVNNFVLLNKMIAGRLGDRPCKTLDYEAITAHNKKGFFHQDWFRTLN